MTSRSVGDDGRHERDDCPVDTNIIFGSPGLRSPAWKALAEQSEEWDLRFAVPDVVRMEAINVVTRDWRSQRDKVRGHRLGEFGLSEIQADMIATIDKKNRRVRGRPGETSRRVGRRGCYVGNP